MFLDIFGPSKHVTKYGPRAPYLLQKYFKTYKKCDGTCYGNIRSVNLGITKFDMSEVPVVLKAKNVNKKKPKKSKNVK